MADSLTIIDNRTGKSYELPIEYGTHEAVINGRALQQIKKDPEDFGILSYDPSFRFTAACKSSITYIDGERGILQYRGYPIDQLADKVSLEEAMYLVLFGELPTNEQRDQFVAEILAEREVPETARKIIDAYPPNSHPMTMLMSAVASLGNFYPDAKEVTNPQARRRNTIRAIGKIATLGAYTYRHMRDLPYVYPDADLSYTGNFLGMLFKGQESTYKPDPRVEKSLAMLFLLHLDHEQNCSANAMRAVGSSQPDVFSALTAAIGALFGPLHGGANEQVVRMLMQIGDKKNVADFVEKVKRRETLLFGFGHPVYRAYDPRARIIKKAAEDVVAVMGMNPLLEVAYELERIALSEDYFKSRNLYPNVDFYSGLIYQSIGLPPDLFTVLFAVGRTTGWMAQWNEMFEDKDQRIVRPRQLFIGSAKRDVVKPGAKAAALKK